MTLFSGVGAQTEHIHDFLASAAKEMTSPDLLDRANLSSREYCQQTHVFIESKCSNPSVVLHAVKSTVERPGTVPVHGIQSALKCSQTWMNLIAVRFVNCFI